MDKQNLNRRDMLLSGLALVAGTAALTAINASSQQLHEVSVQQLASDPAKFDGHRIQTVCTLQSKGQGNIVYPSSGVSLTGMFEADLQQQQCELFAVKGLGTEAFLVGVALGSAAPPIGESLQIEGVLSEARLEGKKVFILTPRTVSRAPLPGPMVPF